MSKNFKYPKQNDVYFNRFVIMELIGSGATGHVFLALDKKHNEKIALKLIMPGAIGSVMKEKIRFEIRLSLDSPYIGGSRGAFEADGAVFVIMPFINGKLFSAFTCNNPLPLDCVLDVSIGVCHALEVFNKQGLVHTDIKSNNILINESGNPVVIDSLSYEFIGKPAIVSGGTIPYCPPELVLRTPVFPQTDTYSLGVMIYEAITGTLPFTGEDDDIVREKIKHGERINLAPIKAIDPNMAFLLSKCLASNLKNRPTPVQLRSELEKMAIGSSGLAKTIQLVYLNSHNKSNIIPIDKNEFVLGRYLDKSNKLISENHAVIRVNASHVTIEDIGSVNGTYVNHKRIQTAVLQHNDIIELANLALKVVIRDN